MKKYTLFKITLLVLISSLLFSCKYETINLTKKYYISSGSNTTGGMPYACIYNVPDRYEGNTKDMLDKYKQKGLIIINETTRDDGHCYSVWANIVLTDVGKKYLVNESNEIYTVKKCEDGF